MPPPDTTEGFFELLVDNPAHGLVTLDVLIFALLTLVWRRLLALLVDTRLNARLAS